PRGPHSARLQRIVSTGETGTQRGWARVTGRRAGWTGDDAGLGQVAAGQRRPRAANLWVSAPLTGWVRRTRTRSAGRARPAGCWLRWQPRLARSPRLSPGWYWGGRGGWRPRS